MKKETKALLLMSPLIGFGIALIVVAIYLAIYDIVVKGSYGLALWLVVSNTAWYAFWKGYSLLK